MYLAAANHPELSGAWRLDVSASTFGSMPPVNYGELRISASPHKILHIAVVTKGGNLERTVEDDWKIDDKYHPVDGPPSGEVLAKWEGSILLGKRRTDSGFEEIRFRLGPDGYSLTESIDASGKTTTLIWRRE